MWIEYKSTYFSTWKTLQMPTMGCNNITIVNIVIEDTHISLIAGINCSHQIMSTQRRN